MQKWLFLYYDHMQEVYLDCAASTPPDPLSLQIVREISSKFYGNPSSSHRAGRQAHELLEQSRLLLAQNLDCLDEELIFTSGATEANNMLVYSLIKRALSLNKDFSSYNIVISGIEHASLWEPVWSLQKLGFRVKLVHPNNYGIIEADTISAALDKQTVMVIVMLINNETGAVQPILELAKRVRAFSRENGRKIIFHCDIVQAVGKIPLSLHKLGIDTASLSGHKLGALKGAGALYVKKHLELDFLYQGGGQEHGKRPGTENLLAVYCFAKLVEKRQKTITKNLEHAGRIMNFCITEIKKLPHAVIIPEQRTAADSIHYSPYIIVAAFPPLPGEVVVRILSEHNIFISTGSACHSQKKERTRVLESMGVTKSLSASAIRVSIGPTTSRADISYLINTANSILTKLQKQLRGG